MKSPTNQNSKPALKLIIGPLAVTAALLVASTMSATPTQSPKVLSPSSKPYGKTYGQWSAAWWKWAMQLPVEGHPFIDTDWNVSAGQSGDVWFLGSPLGTYERECTIPYGKALLVAMNVAEASDLEGLGSTYEERRETAAWLADHAVYSDGRLGSFCIIDGVEVKTIANYRVESPEFQFNAPTPWIFGDTGGLGTAVANGYFVMIAPLAKGQHTIRFGEHWRFTLADDGFDFEDGFDATFYVTVQ